MDGDEAAAPNLDCLNFKGLTYKNWKNPYISADSAATALKIWKVTRAPQLYMIKPPNKDPDPLPTPKNTAPIKPITEAMVVGVEILAT